MNFIEVVNLIFRYKIYSGEKEKTEEKTVIDDISLSINKGDFVGILGHNGSGKSTLAKQLTALLMPGGGAVYVKGMDTSSGEHTISIRKTAGIVFQNPDNQLIGNTVEEDVAFGLENLGVPQENMWGRISEALEATGMTAYRMSSPGVLSGGQKQRIAISGILAMEPECIIFDEPTAMLDPSGRKEIMRAIRYLNREKKITIIYITHHVEEVEDADYLYVMNQGKLVMQGCPDELWRDRTILSENQVALPFFQELLFHLERSGCAVPDNVRNEDQLLKYLVAFADQLDYRHGREKEDPQIKNRGEAAILSWGKEPGDGNKSSDTLDKEGICLDHVSYAYDNSGQKEGQYALKDINLSFIRGEYAAIVGQTGSGKSTLLQHLNGLLVPTDGTYLFDGEDVHQKGYPIHKLRQKVALCFQYPEYQLFEENVLKDIAFGPRNMGLDQETSEKRAREAMRLTGLPEELEAVSPFALSGGQKRRVAMAGILAMDPEYLILDEPAAGLDQEGKRILFELLEELNAIKKVTILLVSHDMDDVIAHARRVVVMKDGEILADGRTEDIFSPYNIKLLEAAGLELPDCLKVYYKLNDSIPLQTAIPASPKELAECISGIFNRDIEGKEEEV